jgi:hypothetical protein
MKNENEGLIIAEEVIISKIYNIRGKQVMIARDLADFFKECPINQNINYATLQFGILGSIK